MTYLYLNVIMTFATYNFMTSMDDKHLCMYLTKLIENW